MRRTLTLKSWLAMTTIAGLLGLVLAAPATGADDATGDVPDDGSSATPVAPDPKAAADPKGTPEAKAADLPPSTVNLSKENDLAGQPLTPGENFKYELTLRCSGLTAGCVNATFTDVLPAGLTVTSLPQSTARRTVTYDEATRKLTVVFSRPLTSPPNTAGMFAGETVNLELGMRLPPDTDVRDGATITNTADMVADNAPQKTASNEIVVSVPRDVTPVATKAWSDGSAVAGSGEDSTISLGVRNGSSSSAEVTELSVTDEDPATYEIFDFTDASVIAFPAGADKAQLLVRTTDGYVAGGTTTAPGPLSLPPGVSAGDVTGVRVVFTNAAGAVLPYDANGGKVDLGMTLRDTQRSDGQPIRPTRKLTVNNCAAPSATDKVEGSVTGTDACKGYDILPDTLDLGSSKTFFPDTDGNFSQNNGEYAVLGENSPVSTKVDVKNNSAFPIQELTITEPDAGAPGVELSKLDTDVVRLRFPAGATEATLRVRYADGTALTKTYTANASEPVVKSGTRVTSVEVTYTGVDADGNPSISEGSRGGLDLHGTLNDEVTSADLPDGSSPGVRNCAAFEGSAGRTDGTGTAAGSVCKTLAIQPPRSTTSGVKTAGQASVPPGQPIPFALKVTNNGNLPLVNPVISDPRTGPDGKPDPNFANPFDTLRIAAASVSKSPGSPGVTIELFDPASKTWTAYDASDAALLERATGARATMNGTLRPTQNFTLHLTTQRRDGVPDGRPILNCFTTDAGGDYVAGDPACAPQIETGAANDSAALNKSINPGTLPEYVPGLPQQFADVKLTVRNNGNMSAKSVQVSDADEDFFDGVDFSSLKGVRFPTGANRVQVDAFVDGAWVNGSPSTTAALPAGVDPTTVRGIRATFSSTSNSNDGYAITPCAQNVQCQGELTFRVSGRQTFRDDPTTPVTGTLTDTANGNFETVLQTPGSPKKIDPVDATLEFTKGTPRLDVDKSPNSTIGPGETAPFYLKVTNNGTANVPDLVVKDDLPKGLAFDDTFEGDAGQPFTVIRTQVPDGTPAVPSPTFDVTRQGDRVTGLAWNFGKDADGEPWILAPGATLTIQIQVQLAPGVTADQVVTNEMGATSSSPDLTCGGASEEDGPFGAGRYCTDTATVTTRAGAAFQARKWVAGNPDLGWFNTRTKEKVAVGGAGCPSTTDSTGRVYTLFPCVALVNPGDQYKYLLRLVNAGTESGTDMRIVDRFPTQGDKGVILDEFRGTDWNTRPTLASAPTIDAGPGVLTTTYTDTEPLCTKDLDMGGAGSSAAQCAPGDWDSPFGPDVTAAQMRLAFATPIPPGGEVSITFAMNTPLDVEQVTDPTIAWNSYAHAETTLRNGRPHVLPPTEPIQVGVATAYGALQLTKKVGDNPSGLPLDDYTFPYRVQCVTHPLDRDPMTVLDETYQVSATAPATVTGIPAGAECKVWETDTRGGVTDHDADDPIRLTIEPGLGSPSVQTAEITNDFPDAVIDLTKKVAGPAKKFSQDAYPVDLTCTFNGGPVDGFDPLQITLHPERSHFQASVPAGAECSAVETDTGGATEVSYDPPGAAGQSGSGTVTTQSGTPQDITITNEFRAGGIVINKEVTGAGAPELAQGPFTFEAVCSFNGVAEAVTERVTIPKGDGTQTSFTSDPITGLPTGASCLVSEIDNGGADATPDPVTVQVPDSSNVVAGFTAQDGNSNSFSAGTIGLTKVLTGDAADEPYAKDVEFTVLVSCQREVLDQNGDPVRATVFSKSVQIKGGQTLEALEGDDGEPVKLPVGTHCFGEETNTGGATHSSVDLDSFDNAAVVSVQTDPSELQAMEITATNEFDLAELTLRKKVDGAAASYVGDREFTLAVTCVLPQGGAEPTPLFTARPYQIKQDQSISIDDVPIGANCWAVEEDTGGATASTVDHGSADDPAVVSETESAAILATNTFDAGALTVSKRVVNGGVGPYGFSLECTTPEGPVALAKSDARFDLKAGAQRRIDVPLGADCSVRELDVAKGDTVTLSDTSGKKHDGVVSVDGRASVQVLNTFEKNPGDTDDNDGADPDQPGSDGLLPNSGGPSWWLLIAGLLALVGGLTLMRVRRDG